MGGRKHKRAAAGGPQEAPRDWIFHVRCYDVAGAHHEFIISKSTLAVEARFLDSHGRTVRAADGEDEGAARTIASARTKPRVKNLMTHGCDWTTHVPPREDEVIHLEEMREMKAQAEETSGAGGKKSNLPGASRGRAASRETPQRIS